MESAPTLGLADIQPLVKPESFFFDKAYSNG